MNLESRYYLLPAQEIKSFDFAQDTHGLRIRGNISDRRSVCQAKKSPQLVEASRYIF